jgi:hypothetical protein
MVPRRNFFPWATLPWATLLLLALLWSPIQALAAIEVGKVLATRGEVSAAAAAATAGRCTCARRPASR